MPRTASRARPGGYRDTTPRYSDADLAPLLKALVAVRDGRARGELDVPGEGAVAEAAAVLEEIRQNGQDLATGLSRVRQEIGREGKLRGRLTRGRCAGRGRPPPRTPTPSSTSSPTWPPGCTAWSRRSRPGT